MLALGWCFIFLCIFPEELRTKKGFVKTNDIDVQFFVHFGTLCLCVVLLADNQEIIHWDVACMVQNILYWCQYMSWCAYLLWYQTLHSTLQIGVALPQCWCQQIARHGNSFLYIWAPPVVIDWPPLSHSLSVSVCLSLCISLSVWRRQRSRLVKVYFRAWSRNTLCQSGKVCLLCGD